MVQENYRFLNKIKRRNLRLYKKRKRKGIYDVGRLNTGRPICFFIRRVSYAF